MAARWHRRLAEETRILRCVLSRGMNGDNDVGAVDDGDGHGARVSRGGRLVQARMHIHIQERQRHTEREREKETERVHKRECVTE